MADGAALRDRLGINDVPDELKKIENGKMVLPPTIHVEGNSYRLYNAQGSQYSNTIRINPENSDRYVYVLEGNAETQAEEKASEEAAKEPETETSEVQEEAGSEEDDLFEVGSLEEEPDDALDEAVEKVKEQEEEETSKEQQEETQPQERVAEKEETTEEKQDREAAIRNVIAKVKIAYDIRSFFKDFYGVEMENFAARLPALKAKYGDFAVSAGLNEYYGAVIGIFARRAGFELDSVNSLLSLLDEQKTPLRNILKEALEDIGFSSRRAANMVEDFFQFVGDANVNGIINAFSAHHTSKGIFAAFRYYQSVPKDATIGLSDITKEGFLKNYGALVKAEETESLKEAAGLEEDVKSYAEELSSSDVTEPTIEPLKDIETKANEYLKEILDSDDISSLHVTVAKANLLDVSSGKPKLTTRNLHDTIKFAISEVMKNRDDEQLDDEFADIHTDFADMLEKAEQGDFETLKAQQKTLSSLIGNTNVGRVPSKALGRLLDDIVSTTGVFSSTYEEGVNAMKIVQDKLNLVGIAMFAAKNGLPLNEEWTDEQYRDLADYLGSNFSLASVYADLVYSDKEDINSFKVDFLKEGTKKLATYQHLVRDESAIPVLSELVDNLPNEGIDGIPEPVVESDVDELIEQAENVLEGNTGDEEKPEVLEKPVDQVKLDYSSFNFDTPMDLLEKLVSGEEVEMSSNVNGENVSIGLKFQDGEADSLVVNVSVNGTPITDSPIEIPPEVAAKVWEDLMEAGSYEPIKADISKLDDSKKREFVFSGVEQKLGYTVKNVLDTIKFLQDADSLLTETEEEDRESGGEEIDEILNELSSENADVEKENESPDEAAAQETVEGQIEEPGSSADQSFEEAESGEATQKESEEKEEFTQETTEESLTGEEDLRELSDDFDSLVNRVKEDGDITYIDYRRGGHPVFKEALDVLSEKYPDIVSPISPSLVGTSGTRSYIAKIGDENISGESYGEVLEKFIDSANKLSKEGKLPKEVSAFINKAYDLDRKYKEEADSRKYEVTDKRTAKYLTRDGSYEWGKRLLDKLSSNFGKYSTPPSRIAKQELSKFVAGILQQLNEDGVIPGDVKVYTNKNGDVFVNYNGNVFAGPEIYRDKLLSLIRDHYGEEAYSALSETISQVLKESKEIDKDYDKYVAKVNTGKAKANDIFNDLIKIGKRKRLSGKTLLKNVEDVVNKLNEVAEENGEEFKKVLDKALATWYKSNTGKTLGKFDNYSELVPQIIEGINAIREAEGLSPVQVSGKKKEAKKEPVKEPAKEETQQKQQEVQLPSESNLKSIYNTIAAKYINGEKQPKEGFISRALKTQLRKALKLDKSSDVPESVIEALNKTFKTSSSSLDEVASELAERIIDEWEKKRREQESNVGEIEEGKGSVDGFDLAEIKKGIKQMMEELPIPPKTYENLVSKYGPPAKWDEKIFEEFRNGLKKQFKNAPSMLETLQNFFPEGFLVEPPKEEEEEEEEVAPSLEEMEGPPEEELEEESEEEYPEEEPEPESKGDEEVEQEEQEEEETSSDEELQKEQEEKENEENSGSKEEGKNEDEDEEGVFDF